MRSSIDYLRYAAAVDGGKKIAAARYVRDCQVSFN